MKKKVIIFTGAISSGGAEKQSVLLAKALNENYNVILISYFGERELMRYINFLIDNNIPYFQLKGSALKKISEFYKIIKRLKPNTIINFLPSNNVIGGVIGKILGVKQIIGGVRSSRQSTLKYLELLLSHLFFSDLTVFNNYAGIDYFTQKGFKKSKSLVISNCIYPTPTKKIATKNTERKSIKILVVSRFEVYKDYETVLNSFKKVVEKSKDLVFKLSIVGTGSQENLIRKRILDLKIDKLTTIAINPENIYEFYEDSDIFLQTSLFEGLSNSIMEAMSYSLPVVATNVGDNNILVHEGVNGFLTNIGDVDMISDKLLDLSKSKEKRNRMGDKSFEIIQSNFTIEKFGENFSKIIK